MNIKRIILVSSLFVLFFINCKNLTNKTSSSGGSSDVALEDSKSKVSYIIGYDIGSNMKKSDLDVDTNLILKGLEDAYSGTDSVISEEEKQQVMMEFQNEMRKKQEEKAAAAKQEGIDYLEKNKKKKGVVVLESGLQYKVLTEGDGPIPQASDMVKTHYVGKLIDGTEFDSSVSRGQPATFPVTGVIQGWQEALQLMKVGSKWELYIPSNLGYGERGTGSIPPNATLVFEIELLSIEDQEGIGAQ